MQWKREEGKRNKIKARERVNDSMPIFSFSWVNKFENKFGRYFWIISEKTCDETIAKLGQILRELTFFFISSIDVHIMYLFYSFVHFVVDVCLELYTTPNIAI